MIWNTLKLLLKLLRELDLDHVRFYFQTSGLPGVSGSSVDTVSAVPCCQGESFLEHEAQCLLSCFRYTEGEKPQWLLLLSYRPGLCLFPLLHVSLQGPWERTGLVGHLTNGHALTTLSVCLRTFFRCFSSLFAIFMSCFVILSFIF